MTDAKLYHIRRTIFAINGRKKIFCYGLPNDDNFDILKQYIDAYFIDDATPPHFECIPVYNIYDIGLFEEGSFYLIVNQPEMQIPAIKKTLMAKLLLNISVDFCMCFYEPFSYEYEPRDFLLGHSRHYNEFDNKYPGFKVFGNLDSNYTIVTLGGSSSDPSLCALCSYSEALYYKLASIGINVTIFAGGYTGYTSSDELLKFLRDVISIKPQMVISYSGVNDFTKVAPDQNSPRYKRPLLSLFQEKLFKWVEKFDGSEPVWGMQNDGSVSEVWVENQKIMSILCENYGIDFVPIFQPWANSAGTESEAIQYTVADMISYHEEINYKNKSIEFSQKIKELIWETNIANFENIFADLTDTDIYYDFAHVYESGNEIIAANILKVLLDRGYIRGVLL